MLFCDTDINGLIWGRVLCFGSAIQFEILLLLTLPHTLCHDVCEAGVWIYSEFKCLLVWMYVFLRRRD